MLGEEGLAALTHRRVATAAGLPLAATTYWFASKDDLLVNAFRRAAERDIARVRRVAAEVGGQETWQTPWPTVLGAELADGRTALVACFTMWVESARRPELRDHRGRVDRGLRGRRRGAPAGRRARLSPQVDSRVLTATLDGLMLGVLARGGSDDVPARSCVPSCAASSPPSRGFSPSLLEPWAPRRWVRPSRTISTAT